ncbi:MAG: ArnT family glycosyltransferase, partial [Anaerolineae bacterium]
LYYALAAIYSVPFNDESLDDLIWHNPGFGYQAPGTVPDNKNMLVHTEVEDRWPWPEAVLAVRSARLASLFFGALTVIAAWGLAYETFIDRRAALITATLVAFHPQFVFMSGVVNNDVSAAALATAVLWMVARILRRGLSLRYVALTGALVGLAALAKTSALLVAPLAGAAILWAGWREERSWAEILKLLVLYTAIALAVGGWWYARNILLYGDPLGLTSHVQTLWGRPEPISLLQLIPELPLLIRSFWGAYGWGHVWWPDGVYVLLTLVAFWFLGCTFWSLLRFAVCVLRSECRVSAERRREQGMLALALFWFGLILAALLRWMTLVEAPHGRLLFPAIGAWALLVGAGSGEIPDKAPLGEARRFVFRLFLLFLVVLATLAPGARILATFAPPRLRSPEAVLREVTPVGLDYEDRARLLGISVEPERVNPGDSVEVSACWEALRPMSQDYTVFVQLLGPENIVVGERRTYPGLGRFPTSI